jgi:dUTP pyrophosphatase
MERYFEKISFQQFAVDIKDDRNLYDKYVLPRRASKHSCGYDFFAIEDVILQPGEIKRIPTGYKAKFLGDEVLLLVIRSSMGFKYNVRMCNQIGVIDADYYNNSGNEGHMWIALKNEGDNEYVINKGEAYCQGIFTKYLTCGDVVYDERNGGIGSTSKIKEDDKDEG